MNAEEKIDDGIKLYRLFSSRDGPVKLFVGGLHGSEGMYTAPILEELVAGGEVEVSGGETIIVPSLTRESRYIYVFSEAYYRNREGGILIHLIEKYRPSCYFEIHTYRKESYPFLIEPVREKRVGVPPFVNLQDGILLGSVSPILRRRFGANDLCLTIELPEWKIRVMRKAIIDLLSLFLQKESRGEIIEDLKRIYPAQIQRAIEIYHEYYRDRDLKQKD